MDCSDEDLYSSDYIKFFLVKKKISDIIHRKVRINIKQLRKNFIATILTPIVIPVSFSNVKYPRVYFSFVFKTWPIFFSF